MYFFALYERVEKSNFNSTAANIGARNKSNRKIRCHESVRRRKLIVVSPVRKRGETISSVMLERKRDLTAVKTGTLGPNPGRSWLGENQGWKRY